VKLKFSTTKLVIAVVLAFLGLDLWYALVYLPAKEVEKWEAVRKELIESGEKLSISDFGPPQVPDERNFFADPLWAELYDREVLWSDGVSFQKARKPPEEWAIDALQKPFDAAERKALEEEFPAFAPLEADKKKLTVIRRHWNAAKKSGDTTQAAKFVLKALAPTEPVMERLRELGGRPEAHFPLVHEDGPVISIEHISPILYVSEWLQLRSWALVAEGRSGEASRDVLLVFRLSRALEQEQVLMVVLVDMTVISIATNMVGRGIRDHAWSEPELVEFDRQLAQFDIPKRLGGGLRSERAVTLEILIPNARKFFPPKDNNARTKALAELGMWLYSTYWQSADKVFYARSIQQWLEVLEQAPTIGMNPGLFPDFADDYRKKHPSGWSWLQRRGSLWSLPTLTGCFRRGARTQVDVFQTRIAIALERYRMKYGEYPEKLDAVVPEFLATMPLDPVTMKPFLYRREESGKFVLWSVGWNEIDENGVPGKKDEEGDWVWVPK
jgi:hypothetical protein